MTDEEIMTPSVSAEVAASMARAFSEAEDIAKLEDEVAAAMDNLDEEEDPREPLYLSAGTTFAFADLVTWRGKRPGDTLTPEVARRIDTLLCSPHDSAALPEELRPFVNPLLTRRQAADYSDCSVRAIALAWVAIDDGVLYVANPHSRAVFDPNRAHGADPTEHLDEFWARLARQRAGEPAVAFAGVDAVRTVTFAGQDVLPEPADEAGRQALREALRACAAAGGLAYEAAVREAVDAVVSARDLAGASSRELTVIGWHDTCSCKCAADGAIRVARPLPERMPSLANFGNRGDWTAEARPGAEPLCAAAAVRRVAAAWAASFGVGGAAQADLAPPPPHACDAPISFNRPYAGGHEVGALAERLRAAGAHGATVFQVEFDRDALLGPAAAAALREPGDDWPRTDEAHVAAFARKLKRAADALRRRESSKRPREGE